MYLLRDSGFCGDIFWYPGGKKGYFSCLLFHPHAFSAAVPLQVKIKALGIFWNFSGLFGVFLFLLGFFSVDFFVFRFIFLTVVFVGMNFLVSGREKKIFQLFLDDVFNRCNAIINCKSASV